MEIKTGIVNDFSSHGRTESNLYTTIGTLNSRSSSMEVFQID